MAKTIAILLLSSPNDVNVPTRGALVLETNDPFVSLVPNLNNKKMFVNSDVSYRHL